MNQTDTRDRVTAIQARLFDAIEAILDALPPRAAAVALPLSVRRRQVANILQVWRFCDRNLCRRSGCCRAEPLHCLHAGLPLTPAEMLESDVLAPLLRRGKGYARRQRRRERLRATTARSIAADA
jgi:hypothetical protein